ncbi:MAG: N-acetylneuraminate lyase [Ruminococcaceae bacterium]|nr:N-acetylneuraminate lyase [Oscillospiraceae bacterium]
MTEKRFDGIFTALLTPFDKNDDINVDSLKKLVRFNLDMGVRGFYVTGSTGEAFLLSTDERKLVMETVKDAAPDATLIAHIGSVNAKEAGTLAKYAKELGYDAISSVAPFYYKYSFAEIKDYYFRLADTAGLPMLVYHIPTFSGVNMGISEMSQFLSDDRFMGIKYTSNDFFTLEQCKASFPDKIVYNGFDEMFLAGLSMGADGAIGSTYNFMADKFVKINELFGADRLHEAQAIQKNANEIITALCKIGVMPAEKEILTQLGIPMGDCRHPFSPVSDEVKEIVKKDIIPLI